MSILLVVNRQSCFIYTFGLVSFGLSDIYLFA